MLSKKSLVAALAMMFMVAAPGTSSAITITHSAADFANTLTVPGSALTDAVGPAFIGSGVNYTFGNTEGVFNDPPNAFCGVNGSNVCDLLGTVDGQIVLTGTTTQGFTDFVEVVAGNSLAGNLTLTVFDIALNIIGTAINTATSIDTLTVDLAGIFDIAFFSVSGTDTFGVRQVTIEDPISNVAAVPVPPALPLFAGGLGLIGLLSWRKKQDATVSWRKKQNFAT